MKSADYQASAILPVKRDRSSSSLILCYREDPESLAIRSKTRPAWFVMGVTICGEVAAEGIGKAASRGWLGYNPNQLMIRELSPADVCRYYDDGFLIVEDLFSREEIAAIAAAAERLRAVGRKLAATLLTGYLGGAVATHVRAGDPVGRMLVPVFFGLLTWGGLYLRDKRLRALVPLRGPRATPAT